MSIIDEDAVTAGLLNLTTLRLVLKQSDQSLGGSRGSKASTD